ncbi:MAG: peptide chain release factor 1 [Flavobacteriales bacterium]|nr:peptide chain release factor 1 [Flavobacteriales bacterium]
MSDLLKKLEDISYRYEEVSNLIVDPNVISDMDRYVKLNKEYKELGELVEAYHSYKNLTDNLKSTKEILKTEKDPEFIEMAKAEFEDLEEKIEEAEEDLKLMLIPKDPNDTKNVIMEIRAGTGGDEASIFAGDLYRMYIRYAEKNGWKTEVININEGTAGGFKEVSFSVEGEDVFGTLKFERGVHRVQRVPATESQGRVHTSAATVAVLPEVEDVEIDLNPEDVKVDTFRASGAGGQHVNKTESAIRLTHIPSGIVVECQDGRSQHKNKDKAFKVLRSRLYEKELEKVEKIRADERKSQVSTGDRSAKIRTYNWPQGRVTDHRIGLTLYNLDSIVGGELNEVVEPLRMAENMEKLKAGMEQ